ncbi:single-stranded DNA-binding protein [Proteus mirabilis]|uniref:Single-stranded DNA-binding protein n=1 Tax=Proteus mirabilis TaxID=584 RepID=A0A379FG21_PROMI|nr:single-stranded DNA-binding protein [Proteus mirabilis]
MNINGSMQMLGNNNQAGRQNPQQNQGWGQPQQPQKPAQTSSTTESATDGFSRRRHSIRANWTPLPTPHYLCDLTK